MKPFDLKSWLKAHSTAVEQIGEQLHFTHIKDNKSVLLSRESWRDDLIPVEIEPLATFYSDYFGASVGGGQLLFATNVAGGLDISRDLRLPDFYQMEAQARELGMRIKKSEFVFLAEAGWMFIYTVSNEGGEPVLRRYDRDFGTDRVVESLDEVLDNWWAIVEAD